MLNIIKHRKYNYIVSIVLTVLAFIFIFFIDLNLWIDMTGGTQSEYNYSKQINIDEVRTKLDDLKKEILIDWNEIINNIDVYKITWENKFSIVAWFDSKIDDKDLESYKLDFRNKVLTDLKQIDPEIQETQYTNIWKTFWDYIKNTAILTIIIAVLSIALYLAWAFSWILSWWKIILSFSFIVIITLFHDVIVAAWFYIFTSDFFPEFKVDTFFITALLTILGFSINDTIVIFDRIRHNLKIHTKKDKLPLDEIIDLSINETLSRSIYTSFTVVLVLIAVLIFWPETIKWFVLTMIYWTLVWTYSSIFIASPLLYDLNKNESLELYEKKKVRNEDKIVV